VHKSVVGSGWKIQSLFKQFILAALPLLLAACASDQPVPIPGLKESFHTEIAANGAKRFSYSLEMARQDIPPPFTQGGRGRMGGMSRDSAIQGGRQRGPGGAGPLQFDKAMQQKLTETGFCREGYFEIERSVSAMGGEVRGECREGAVQ
jgi:hypothetical protein